MRLIDHLTKEQRRALYGRRNHTACVKNYTRDLEVARTDQQRRDALTRHFATVDQEIAALMKNR